MLIEIKCIDGVPTSRHLRCSGWSPVSVPLKAVQADGALFRGESVVLIRMGNLCEALLGPQFRWAVVVWSGLLEPRLVERVALQGRNGRSLQPSTLHDPVVLLLVVPSRAAGVKGSSDIALAEELQRTGMADVWVRLGIIVLVLTCLLLALPGRRLTSQTGGLAGET